LEECVGYEERGLDEEDSKVNDQSALGPQEVDRKVLGEIGGDQKQVYGGGEDEEES